MIQISDCPITGLNRKITAKDLYFKESSKEVILRCFISHYKEGELIENARIQSYEKILLANNDTPVDKRNGNVIEIVDSTDEAGNTTSNYNAVWNDSLTIGQFDFFKFLKTQPVKQEDLEISYIQSNDLKGNFNI